MRSDSLSLFQYLSQMQRKGIGYIAAAIAMTIFLGMPVVMAEESSDALPEAPASPEGQISDPGRAVFATVNDMKILMRDYSYQYALVQRDRYYHAKVQEHKLAEFQREIRDMLIEKALLIQEVNRRADPVNTEELQTRLDKSMEEFDKRYVNDEAYQKDRDTLLEGIKSNIMSSMRMRDLEKNVRDAVVDPGEDVLRQYYKENIELFTQPGQYRLSVILIGLDPSGGAQPIMDAVEEAAGLVKALREGNADFAELAEAISTDKSSVNGGDMGYQHQGMLAPGVESLLSDMSVGDISDPIRVLEGISIFRLDDRVLPNVQPYDVVRERVLGLWLREHKDKAWNDLIAGLRKKAKIVVHDDFFEPLPDAPVEGSVN